MQTFLQLQIPGKSLIGGEAALENCVSIKHLNSKESLTGFDFGFNTGITQPLKGNKRDFNENREKRLLSNKALDKGASTSHQDTSLWDSIYKNRAKSMVSILIVVHLLWPLFLLLALNYHT